MTKINRKRKKVGDVVSFELPDGRFAFYRVFQDGFVGFYDHFSDNISDLPKKENYLFLVVVYKEVFSVGTIVEHYPFKNDIESKGPVTYMKNKLLDGYYLLKGNEMIPATREECLGLEKASVWGIEHITNRILGDNTIYKRLIGEDFEDWEKNRERRLIELGFNKD